MLTIGYTTNRKEPCFKWFIDSLLLQLKEYPDLKPKIVVVDFWADELPRTQEKFWLADSGLEWVWTVPKPCVYQGKHKITKDEWFCAANSRNTTICLAPDGHLAYVDDLSVLMPGWLMTVVQSMSSNLITLGAYKKVKELIVENGIATSYKEFPQGVDSRLKAGKDTRPCNGEWLFGCSLAAPVEAYLTVGSWPESCNSLGFEDSIMGLALQNAGFKFVFCPTMLTLESEEMHAQLPVFKRIDKGKSPLDKSHGILNMVRGGCRYFENYYEGGIRRMREEVLSGKPFPIVGNPLHDWWDGQPLTEL